LIERHVNVGEFGVDDALLDESVLRALETSDHAEGEVSVTLVGDEDIRSLNRRYLDRDRVTDVIAFTLSTADEPLVGDVYIGYDQAVRQAGETGVELEQELVRLAVHGVLHVLGHDHPEGSERVESPMWALQEQLVAQILDGHG